MNDKQSIPNLVELTKRGYVNDTSALKLKFYNKFTKTNQINSVINSIGNLETDVETIKERQKIFKSILDDQNKLESICKLTSGMIPNDYYSLLNYVRQGTGFYENISQVLYAINNSNCYDSKKLSETKNALESMLKLESSEKELMNEILEDVNMSQRLFGFVDLIDTHEKKLEDSFKIKQTKGKGIKLYPTKTSDNEFVNGVPDSVLNDIKRYIYGQEFKNLSTVGLTINYVYSDGKLKLKATLNPSNCELSWNGRKEVNDLKEEARKIFNRKIYVEPSKFKFLQKIREKETAIEEKNKLNEHLDQIEDILYENVLIDAKKKADELSTCIIAYDTNEEFISPPLENIFNKHESKIKLFEKLREDFANFVNQISDYVQVGKFFKEKKQQGYNYSFPEILDSKERKIQISKLYSLRLIHTKGNEKIVPNDVYSNGKPNVITGYNAHGKSIYLDSEDDAIIMAQAGLPIFADAGAKMSVKDALFLHFIKDGNAEIGQSTFQNSIIGIKQTLSDITKYDNPHITIDELGAGTDPESTYKFSERIIKTISDLSYKASSNIVTQFTNVAELAKDKYNANVLQVNENYELVPGIGNAEGLKLADDMGLTEEFCSSLVK
jgi:hypothetical protein